MPVMDRIGSWIRRTHPNAPLARDPGIFMRHTNDPDMARLLAAMARKESEFGSTSGRLRNNAYGYGIHLGPSVNTAANWDEMQQRVMRALQGNLYRGSNLRRPSEIINRWAPPSENNTNLYNDQVSQWIREMGGDPSADVFDGRDGATGQPGPQLGSGAANQSGAVPEAPQAMRQQGLDTGSLIGEILGRQKGQRISDVILGAAIRQRMASTPPVEAPGQEHYPGDGHDHSAGGPKMNPNTDAPPKFNGLPKWTPGGGPEAHHSRALGNWQSDDAYDIMGKTNDPVYAGVSGTVTKISGSPGGNPGFAGYGITVDTPQGQFFFKHLNTARVRVGQRITPQTLLGTLDPVTAGGPHLHLGGTNRAALDQLYKWYINGGK